MYLISIEERFIFHIIKASYECRTYDVKQSPRKLVKLPSSYYYLLIKYSHDGPRLCTTFLKKNVVPSNKHPCKVITHKLLNQACIYLKIQNIT